MFEKERVIEITEKEAPWAPEDELGTYKLRRWTWYQKQQAVETATEIIDEQKGLVDLKVADYYAQMMLISIVEAPFEVTLERIKTLDAHIGDILRDACREINGLVWDEKARFLEPLDSDEDTPG